MANENLIGTCPACFGTFVVVKGKVRKHGWSEVGGRQVGVYGHAFHTGECFGVGYEPFEISTKGTIEFLAQVLTPALKRTSAHVAELKTFPDLIYTGHVSYHDRSARYGRTEAPYSVMLKHGMQRKDGIRFCASDDYNQDLREHNFHHPSYDSYHKTVSTTANIALDSVTSAIDKCETAIKNWTLGEVKPKAQKPVKFYHKAGEKNANGYVYTTACGKRVLERPKTLLHREGGYDVTCPDCLALKE